MLAPTLTVVVTAHNVESKLRRQLHGMIDWLTELASEFEVLVVDDGSLDDTLTVAQELAREFPQIKVMHRSMRYGEVAAMQRAFPIAQGDKIATYCAADAPELFRTTHLSWQTPMELPRRQPVARSMSGRRQGPAPTVPPALPVSHDEHHTRLDMPLDEQQPVGLPHGHSAIVASPAARCDAYFATQ